MKRRIKSDYNTKYFVDFIQTRLGKKYGMTYPQVSKILSMYHKLAREDFAKGESIHFKEKLGNLQLYKEKRRVYIDENGELVNELPVNWTETFKLWKNKPDLKNKTYIRYTNKHSDGFVFTTSYQISKATFKFKNVYSFQFNDMLKEMLHNNIMEGSVDAYIKKF
jgi:hypothetical protein